MTQAAAGFAPFTITEVAAADVTAATEHHHDAKASAATPGVSRRGFLRGAVIGGVLAFAAQFLPPLSGKGSTALSYPVAKAGCYDGQCICSALSNTYCVCNMCSGGGCCQVYYDTARVYAVYSYNEWPPYQCCYYYCYDYTTFTCCTC